MHPARYGPCQRSTESDCGMGGQDPIRQTLEGLHRSLLAVQERLRRDAADDAADGVASAHARRAEAAQAGGIGAGSARPALCSGGAGGRWLRGGELG
jgi:hypothetical protein